MPGGGLQRSAASLYRRMMPHSDAGEGSDRSSGLGRGKGRGKGGPKRGRGKGGGRRLREPSPVPPSEEEEEEVVVEPAQDQEQEREEEWQADAQEEGGSRLVLRRTRPRIPLRRLSGCEVPRDSQIGRYLLPCLADSTVREYVSNLTCYYYLFIS